MFKRIAQKFKRRPRQEAEQIELQTSPPRLRPASPRDAEPARPYRDYVESEVRKYWEETAMEHNLVKPDHREIHLGIACVAHWNRSGYSRPGLNPGSRTMEPAMKIDTVQGVEPAAFVEDEAREYWKETTKKHRLNKPSQQEIRTAAMPILCLAFRNRFGSRRHRAVAALAQHNFESGLIGRPCSEASGSPSYIDALIQLADDADWLAREIPLPDHPPPHHPPVYYTTGSGPGGPVPVPREDALIRGDYVYNFKWYPGVPVKSHRLRLIDKDYFYPSALKPADETDFNRLDQGHNYYTLEFMPVSGPIHRRPVNIVLHWKELMCAPKYYGASTIHCLHFSPYPWDMIPGSPAPRSNTPEPM